MSPLAISPIARAAITGVPLQPGPEAAAGRLARVPGRGRRLAPAADGRGSRECQERGLVTADRVAVGAEAGDDLWMDADHVVHLPAHPRAQQPLVTGHLTGVTDEVRATGHHGAPAEMIIRMDSVRLIGHHAARRAGRETIWVRVGSASARNQVVYSAAVAQSWGEANSFIVNRR